MAKLKVETNRDTTLVRFDALKDGEVFHIKEGACMKTNRVLADINAVNLETGDWLILDEHKLVTYVVEAELKLTI